MVCAIDHRAEIEEVVLDWKVIHELRYVLPDHKDPADRFQAAIAIAQDLVLVTAAQMLRSVPGLRLLGNV